MSSKLLQLLLRKPNRTQSFLLVLVVRRSVWCDLIVLTMLLRLKVLIRIFRTAFLGFWLVMIRGSFIRIFGSIMWDLELWQQRSCTRLAILLRLTRHLMTLRVPQEGLLLGLRVAVLLLIRFWHGNLALNDFAINFVLLLTEHSLYCFLIFESHESEPSRHQRSVNHDHTLLNISESTEELVQRFFCRSCSKTSHKDFPIKCR